MSFILKLRAYNIFNYKKIIMKSKLFILFALSLFFFSCQDNDLTVTLKQSGNLSVKITDNKSKALSNVKVKLYSGDGSTSYSMLDALTSGADGVVNFGELNYGSYTLVVDTPKVDGIKYLPMKTVQVISGSSKQVSINVQEYVGTLKIIFSKYSYTDYSTTLYSGLNVLLVPYEDYTYSSTLDIYMQAAEFISKADATGTVNFKIPSDRTYYVIIYDDNLKKEVLGYIYVDKDESVKLNTLIYPNDLQ